MEQGRNTACGKAKKLEAVPLRFLVCAMLKLRTRNLRIYRPMGLLGSNDVMNWTSLRGYQHFAHYRVTSEFSTMG